jgi:hypothetical protein
MFVVFPGKPFQPSLMYVSKARAYLRGSTFQVLHSRVNSWLDPHRLGLPWEKHPSLLKTFLKNVSKKFYVWASVKILDSDKHSNLSARSVSDEEKIFITSTKGRLEQSR